MDGDARETRAEAGQKTGTKGAERKAPPEPSDDEARAKKRPEDVHEPREERHRPRDEKLDRNM